MELATIETPGVYSFANLKSSNLTCPVQAVEGLIHEGQNTIFAGYFGVGKTMFLLQLGISLASGREFLGRKISRPYKVVFVDYETGPGPVRERIATQLEAARLTEEEYRNFEKNWTYIDALDVECPLYGVQIDKQGFERLSEFLKRRQTEVLILDNLGWFSGDLQKPEEVKSFYRQLRALRNTCGSLKIILLPTHLTKPGEKSDRCDLLHSPREYLARARGSMRLLDFAECRLALDESVIEDEVVHIVNGVNRFGPIRPMVMQMGSQTLSFDLHEDTDLLYRQAFTGRGKQRKIFEALPDEFNWSQAIKIQVDGKQISPNTLISDGDVKRLGINAEIPSFDEPPHWRPPQME